MNIKTWLISALAIASANAFGEIRTLFDFEDPKAVKIIGGFKGGKLGVTDEMAAFGERSFVYAPENYREGGNEWPSFTLEVPEGKRDWTSFEKLSVDAIGMGSGNGELKCFLYSQSKKGLAKFRVQDVQALNGKCWRRWEFHIDTVEARKAIDFKNITGIHFFMTRPVDMKIYLDEISLMLNTESLPLPESPKWKAHAETIKRAQREATEKERAAFKAMIERVKTENKERGFDLPKLALAAARPTEKIRPTSMGDFTLSKDGLKIRLARNEYEAMQLLAMPTDGEIKGLGARVVGAVEGLTIKASPVGYVKTEYEPPYLVYPALKAPELGWWPEPILTFLDRVDVKGGTWQSFWIDVYADSKIAADEYELAIEVFGDGIKTVKIPLKVRVNNFTLPKTPVIPMAVTFNPGSRDKTVGKELATKITRDPESPVNLWKRHKNEWTDFLADHGVQLFNLYCDGQAFHSELDFEQLERLDKQGRLTLINVGYWGYPKSSNEVDKAAWRKKTLPRLKGVWAKIVARGWQHKSCLYGCDEIAKEYFPLIRWTVDELKREFPGVPIFTTAYDHSFGTGADSLNNIDWFTPLTPRWDDDVVECSRDAGHKVWWYTCCSPNAPWANIFLESSGIETRLLMGAMTQKYRPDGYLYYQIAIWNSLRPITSGPYTDWEPRSFRRFHGDGQWVCCGPDGTPLSTVRFENFRDGLEDLAYARELERVSGRVVKVPKTIVKDLTSFTLNAEELFQWRDRIADAIEREVGGIK